jgi:outer membrane lipoprotein-sorting protein
MRKLFRGVATALLLVGVMSVQAQSVDEILAKHFETIGQSELSNVQTMQSEGKIVVQGLEIPFSQKYKRKGKFYMESSFQGMKMIQAFNGETGWQVNPLLGITEPQDLAGLELKSALDNADVDGPLHNYASKGNSVELLGSDTFEGADVYKLKLTKSDGSEAVYFMDSENYVILKTEVTMVVEGNTVTSSSIMGNYKEVDGVMMAHSITTSAMGQNMNLIIDKIEFGVEVDDSIFAKPTK